MEKIIKEGKTAEEVLEQLLKENNLNLEDILYKTYTKKGGLFKSSLVEITAYTKNSIYKEIKEYLTNLINGLGLEVSFEIQNKEDHTIIKMYSDNNPILIGKNGQTLKALEILTKQMLNSKYGLFYKVTLDVENYKGKRQESLERLAKRLAKEVSSTKTEIHMDNMTSYERRIVHNILTNFKGITTESEGEEPNRHVVIKPKN